MEENQRQGVGEIQKRFNSIHPCKCKNSLWANIWPGRFIRFSLEVISQKTDGRYKESQPATFYVQQYFGSCIKLLCFWRIDKEGFGFMQKFCSPPQPWPMGDVDSAQNDKSLILIENHWFMTLLPPQWLMINRDNYNNNYNDPSWQNTQYR